MRKRFVKRALFIFLLFSFLLISQSNLVFSKEARGVTKDSIKIGSIADHTGPTSNIGVVVIEAYKNLFSHINDKGGIHERKIKLIMEDDRYSIPAGIAAFKKLVFKDQVLAIIGPLSVGEVKVLFRHVDRYKIPMLPWAPDKSMMEPYKRYIFPTNGLYNIEMGVIFDHIINELKPENPKIAFATGDAESGKVIKASAKNWAKYYGQKLHIETIPISAIDVTSQVLSMKRAGITHMIVHHVAPGVAAVLKDMKKFGLNIPLFGSSPSCTEDVIRIAGDASKNYVGISPYSSWYEESPGMAKVRKISMKYNPKAEKSYRIKSYILGWVMAEILGEGLMRAGQALDAEKLVEALETIKDYDTKGLCGPITYTPTVHYGLNYNKLFRTDPENSKLIPITEWRLPPQRE